MSQLSATQVTASAKAANGTKQCLFQSFSNAQPKVCADIWASGCQNLFFFLQTESSRGALPGWGRWAVGQLLRSETHQSLGVRHDQQLQLVRDLVAKPACKWTSRTYGKYSPMCVLGCAVLVATSTSLTGLIQMRLRNPFCFCRKVCQSQSTCESS